MHVASDVRWGNVEAIVPELELPASADDDAPPPQLWAMAFDDPDGVCHVYLFGPDGRDNLRRLLNQGAPTILLPNGDL